MSQGGGNPRHRPIHQRRARRSSWGYVDHVMESFGGIASGYIRLPTCRGAILFNHLRQRFDSDLGQTHFVGRRLGPRRSAATCSSTGRPSQASASRIYSVAASPSAPLSGDVRCLTALHLIGLIHRKVSFAAHTPCEKCATQSRCSEDAVQTDYANAT
jgi:hypothetical protein